ncbi:hypothetical protein Nmel_009906, partial [Mimus melanotis]
FSVLCACQLQGLRTVLSCDRVAQPPCPCEQPVHSATEEGRGLGCALLSTAAGVMLRLGALLPSYTCCFALPYALFMATFVCLQNTEK